MVTFTRRIDRQVMPHYMKIGFLVGGAGFLMGMFLMFVFMGLPIGSILLAIPVGIITGRLLVRRKRLVLVPSPYIH